MADASAAQAPAVARRTPACPTPPTQVRLAAYPKGMPWKARRAFGLVAVVAAAAAGAGSSIVCQIAPIRVRSGSEGGAA